MRIVLLLLLFFSRDLLATPKKVEVWFLSAPSTASLNDSLQKLLAKSELSSLAYTDEILKDCTPMGDGCFHPQIGYIDQKPLGPSEKMKDESVKVEPKEKKGEKKSEGVQVKTINALETDLISCDKDYYFDIYCGQAKKEQAVKGKMEIWVDTSSSLKSMDYSKDNNHCYRRSFITRVLDGCPNGAVGVSVYDTSKKELGDHSTLCLAYGMNNAKRLMDWITESEANYLIVITDIDEQTTEFSDFLATVGAKIRGIGVKPMYASEMGEIATDIVLQCRGKK